MKHATSAQPDIQVLEKALGCVVEGLEEPNHLLVRFWFVDPHNPGREFTFVLDTSGTGYRGAVQIVVVHLCSSDLCFSVVTSSPPLPTLPILVDSLNESGDIFWFVLAMRQAFAKLVSP